ncbi:carbonic anhydrase [Pontixanthobacter gangjinensis]|uniref:carbonic anhydrase n=1 Tax=Pontixanthobacter gangjinensis TaxID=1028742 RepID=A0A6I4SLH5_9SPHN|nr:carbonic anhydrase family protein [Pontixanthobacter gangjinensis]MXO56006.1 carbonic anhydrase family protein [Pontixanthobacter gangjinensis]
MKNFVKFGVAAAATVSLAGTALATDWSYEGATGPENWGSLDPAFEKCSSGLMQSPIDLAEANARADVSVFTDYQPGPLTILNNGHTVEARFAEGSKLTSGTMQFNLLQVHFHTPSEEVMHGQQYPMVAHFVHADATGKLAVLGVLFEIGDANAELAKIIEAAPATKADPRAVSDVTLDPNGMLPDDLDVFRFQGSLTTPPCSEGVNWHVAKDTVTMSEDQLRSLGGIMGNNARPVQDLNGRLLVAPAG